MGKKSFPYPYPSGQIPDGYRVPVPKLPSLMVVNAGAGAGNWNPRMLMGRMVDQGIVPYTIFFVLHGIKRYPYQNFGPSNMLFTLGTETHNFGLYGVMYLSFIF
jgi:hypothetical protein